MTATTATRIDGLDHGQVGMAVLVGVTLWFAAATLLRFVGPLGVFDGANRIGLYIAIVPGTVPFIWAIVRVTRLSAPQIVPGVALVTGAALLCDGVAVAWFPAIYGPTSDAVRSAAAAVLWGAGVAIAIALVLGNRGRSHG